MYKINCLYDMDCIELDTNNTDSLKIHSKSQNEVKQQFLDGDS